MREITFGEALREALREEMLREERVFLMGEDIGVFGGAFKVTQGLLDEFGEERVRDTPISEAAIAGIGVGAAMSGMHPVIEIMFGDFMTIAMDQIVNHAAKMHYMTGGKAKVPLTIRTTMGAGRSSAATHSQSLHAWFCHIPGLKVVIPSTPYDAKGLLKTAIRDENPVVIFEDKMIYNLKGPVPEEEYLIQFGEADIKREGKDATVVATSSMVHVAMKAAEELSKQGVEVEIIDPRTLVPLDTEALCDSAAKTGHVVIVDEGHRQYGVTAELAGVIAEGAFDYLDAPIKRVGAMDVPIPFTPALEFPTIPDEEDVMNAVLETLA